jgi:acyl carrier protein
MFFAVNVNNGKRNEPQTFLFGLRFINDMMAGEVLLRVEFSRRLAVLDRSGATERVPVLVRALLAKRSIERPVGYNDDLGESGLSSLDLVNLMLAVEAEFGLKIPDADMRPTNFRSIARIDALIARIQGQT